MLIETAIVERGERFATSESEAGGKSLSSGGVGITST
jgi:hypothetical protein